MLTSFYPSYAIRMLMKLFTKIPQKNAKKRYLGRSISTILPKLLALSGHSSIVGSCHGIPLLCAFSHSKTSNHSFMEKLRNVLMPRMSTIPVHLASFFLGMIAVSGSFAGHWKAFIKSSISETISGFCLARLRFSPISDSRL